MMPARSSLALRGALRVNASLKKLNSWRVGGAAERLYQPADTDDLALFLSGVTTQEPLTWLGLGTNILVRDGGVRGTVIAVHAALNDIFQIAPTRLRAQAGVPCAKVARFCTRLGLTGAEFMVGIPGTLGGALAMNAGAFGGQTWDLVAAVETMDRLGQIRRRSRSEFKVDYRQITAPGEEWFVTAELALKPAREAAASIEMRTLLERRQASQPLGMLSCGSVFRNPSGDFAGRLIDAAGMKGHRIGGASVSDRHANFIINIGDATAADIEALIEFVQQRVEATHGVRLIPEVRIIGTAES